ncbi:MAG TPA: hypothetical protein VIL74_11155 [Pyrinomonadaceae bacterium]
MKRFLFHLTIALCAFFAGTFSIGVTSLSGEPPNIDSSDIEIETVCRFNAD